MATLAVIKGISMLTTTSGWPMSLAGASGAVSDVAALRNVLSSAELDRIVIKPAIAA